MPDAGIRARVIRFLTGDFNPEDLVRIFLFTRDRCDGRESVQELGDFVAHKTERAKGVVTREARDWALIAHFMALTQISGNMPPFPPPQFVAWLHATLRRAPARARRYPMAKAEKLVREIEAKIVLRNDGNVSLERLTGDELAYINRLTSSFVLRPAFTAERLSSDMKATLRSNGVLETSEVSSFDVKRHLVELFAVTLMHGCVVDLGNGLNTTLVASDPVNGGPINVSAPIPVPNPAGLALYLSSAMYETTLLPQDHMDPALVNTPLPWPFELELRADGRLYRL